MVLLDKIPKIIHFIWMGKGKKNNLIKKCIRSWHKFLPDYKIIEWNEKNFDINSNNYVKQAYENKKWAFVSDYIRLYAIYNFGGIYLDTDVEILKPIDIFLKHSAFSGFESKDSIPTGIMGGIKGHIWYKELLDYYDNKQFVDKNGNLDITTNVKTITDITYNNYKLVKNNQYQILEEDIHIYPSEYFCPINPMNGDKNITPNTYAIHHFNGSWCPKKERFKKRILISLDNRVAKCILNYKNFFKGKF